MKKSELLEILSKIEEDPEIVFAVDTDAFLSDDYAYIYCDVVSDVAVKTLYHWGELVYTDRDDVLEAMEGDLDKDYGVDKTELDVELEKLEKEEKLIIKIGV